MEDVARAVGAGGNSIVINAKRGRIRPVTIKELTEIERECVRAYRREYLARLNESLEFLGQEKFDQAIFDSARWGVENLPRKKVYDPRPQHLTPAIVDWLTENTGSDRSELENQPVKALRALATVLDNEALGLEEFEKLAGETCQRISTGYVNWWITATFEGMVELAYYSLRDSGITREDLLVEFSKRQNQLWQVAREAELLSSPSMGNGQDPSK